MPPTSPHYCHRLTHPLFFHNFWLTLPLSPATSPLNLRGFSVSTLWRARVVAPSIKCFPCKHEHLCWSPRTHTEMLGMELSIIVKAETDRSLEVAGQPAWPTWRVWGQWETETQRTRWMVSEEQHLSCPVASTHTCTNVHYCTHIPDFERSRLTFLWNQQNYTLEKNWSQMCFYNAKNERRGYISLVECLPSKFNP